jgi:hypothetical protein
LTSLSTAAGLRSNTSTGSPDLSRFAATAGVGRWGGGAVAVQEVVCRTDYCDASQEDSAPQVTTTKCMRWAAVTSSKQCRVRCRCSRYCCSCQRECDGPACQ